MKGEVMRTTAIALAGIIATAVIYGVCVARPVQAGGDYDKMTAEADLVVIASPIATKELNETIDLPGIMKSNRQPVRGVGLDTTFQVTVCFKGKLPAAKKPTFILHHYRFEDPNEAHAVNGAQLLQLKPGDRLQYLMFLRRSADGRYVPFNGQTDPVCSIELLRKRKAD
jgi:hypothetical protein